MIAFATFSLDAIKPISIMYGVITLKVESIDLNSDLGVVNAARVSMDKWHDDFQSSDSGLLDYLSRELHWTPYSHPHSSFRVTAPIFVARQLAKHQIGLSISEVSRRYISSPPSYWFPKAWRRAVKNVKQGSGSTLSAWKQVLASGIYKVSVWGADRAYKALLSLGVCPEQARAVLPQATLTTWCWTGSLAAWNRVASLRLDPHAQQECRDVIVPIAAACAERYPHAWAALRKHAR